MDRIHITKIDLTPASDWYFPDLDADPAWQCTEEGPWQEEDGVRYRFCTYERAAEQI
jgi:dihydrofolate reductase